MQIPRTLCLDFANTLGDRSATAEEELRRYPDLVEWALGREIVDAERAAQLRGVAEAHPGRARTALGAAIRFRESLFALFSSLARGRGAAGSLITLNAELRRSSGLLQLEADGRGFAWQLAARTSELGVLTAPVARSAADLLLSDEVGALRECASDSCSWLFLDRSRTHRRRWCDMKSCGNREKVRRFYARQKARRAP